MHEALIGFLLLVPSLVRCVAKVVRLGVLVRKTFERQAPDAHGKVVTRDPWVYRDSPSRPLSPRAALLSGLCVTLEMVHAYTSTTYK